MPAGQRKFPVQGPLLHFARGLADPLAALLIQHAKLVVGLCGHALEAGDGMDELQRNWIVANLKAMPGPFGLRTPVALSWNGHIAKAVVFEPPGLGCVAELIRHKAKRCADDSLIVHPYH